MNTVKRSLLVACLFILPFTSFAWGVLGHRIVGQVAHAYLTPKARAAIKSILGNESVAMASNWADFIRSDTTMKYLDPWHYVNLPKGLGKDEFNLLLKKDTAVDLYTKTDFIVNELRKKNLAADKKVMYLKLLIHMVGDAHQPLHTGRKEDRGGNGVRVNWFGTPTNLHAVWDEWLVNFQQLSYTEYTAAINHITATQRKTWQAQPMGEWLYESYQIAEALYPEITEKDQRLSYEYNYRHIKTVNDRLLKGGIRLAGLLNRIFQ